MQFKVLGRSINKKEREFSVLFLCFFEKECSYNHENHTRVRAGSNRRGKLSARAIWTVGFSTSRNGRRNTVYVVGGRNRRGARSRECFSPHVQWLVQGIQKRKIRRGKQTSKPCILCKRSTGEKVQPSLINKGGDETSRATKWLSSKTNTAFRKRREKKPWEPTETSKPIRLSTKPQEFQMHASRGLLEPDRATTFR